MAPTFVFAIAAQLLAKLSSPIFEELSLAWGFRDDLFRLANTVSSVHAVLLDAQERQVLSHQMKNWLHKLEVALYHAEDVLEEFEIDALYYKVSNTSILRKASREFSRSNRVVFRFKMAHKIKNIRKTFDEIAADKNRFNLIERSDERVIAYREMTHSFVRDEDVIGRDKDREDVIRFLMDDVSVDENERVSVLPIIGLGGIGKTTLAKLVYNDERLVPYFDLKIWVCVAEEFQLERVIKEILKSMRVRDCDNLKLEQLQQCLRENLEDQKYFLVMDDMWNENHAIWVELRCLLTSGASGSKIIVTTRNQSVASIVGTTNHIIEVQGLSHEQSLSLFLKWAFRSSQDAIRHPHLVGIAGGIVEKCKGVPLAVRTLGSILYTKTEESAWIDVRDNELWNLEQEEGHILPALKLSYLQLPSNLRRCFAFCSVFPKDYSFSSIDLMMDWKINGLLQPFGNNQNVEDVGIMYIKKLLSRGFFQEFEDYGSVFGFKMHDLMHDLATLVAEHDCIHLGSQKVQDRLSTRILRHVSFPRNHVITNEISEWLLEQKENVHTVTFPDGIGSIKSSFVETYISKFKYLRSLDICYSHIKVLPSIGRMKHLKYLDLSNNHQLKELPSLICKLVGLEYLNFTGCLKIKKLPRGLGQLFRLRFLGVTTKGLYLPDNEMRCLTSLQTLMIADCSNLKTVMSDDAIRCLCALHFLAIDRCESLVSLPLKSLRHLTRLETISITDCRNLEFTVDNHCDSGKSETPVTGEEGINPIRMLVLWGLPKLETLPLCLVHGAKHLKILGVGECDNLTNFMTGTTLKSFNSLQRLSIRSCPKLTSLPVTMRCLTALKEIQIVDCPELVIRCQRYEKDWYKIRHVPKVFLNNIEI